jgi:hypothetical protein
MGKSTFFKAATLMADLSLLSFRTKNPITAWALLNFQTGLLIGKVAKLAEGYVKGLVDGKSVTGVRPV